LNKHLFLQINFRIGLDTILVSFKTFFLYHKWGSFSGWEITLTWYEKQKTVEPVKSSKGKKSHREHDLELKGGSASKVCLILTRQLCETCINPHTDSLLLVLITNTCPFVTLALMCDQNHFIFSILLTNYK